MEPPAAAADERPAQAEAGAPEKRRRVAEPESVDASDVHSVLSAASAPSGEAAAAAAAAKSAETSILIFRRFIIVKGGVVDASGVVGKACYEHWINTRTNPEPKTEMARTFQRALTAHITGSDGRKPFSPEEEAAVLQVVREKRVWAAFAGTSSTIGSKGFRALGHHEKLRGAGSPLSRAAPKSRSGKKAAAMAAMPGAMPMMPWMYPGVPPGWVFAPHAAGFPPYYGGGAFLPVFPFVPPELSAAPVDMGVPPLGPALNVPYGQREQ